MAAPTVTLVCTTCELFDEHIAAANQTERCFPIPVRKLFVSGEPPARLPSDFAFLASDVFATRNYWAYNRWVYEKLYENTETDFICTIHADGFAQHPEHWTDEFLAYDYVGAPFPVGLTGGVGRVGSGGFCLRSRKLLKACTQIPMVHDVTEDWHIGHNCFRQFEALGCHFAPVPLALQWSVDLALEDYPDWQPSMSFGFHDNHHKKQKVGNFPPYRIW